MTSSIEDQGELHAARIGQLGVMGTLSVCSVSYFSGALLILYLGNAVMRFWSAEVFAFAFHILHMCGHVVLLINIVHQFDPSAYVYVYSLLLVWGTSLCCKQKF